MPDKILSGIYGYKLFTAFMQLKILPKQALLLAVILSGLIFFLALFLYLISLNSSKSRSSLPISYIDITSDGEIKNTVAFSSQEQEAIGLPVRLKIPSINIDAPIEHMGLTSDGAMDVPKDPFNVAWFNLGPRPGEKGSAVIAGHYGWKNNTSAVFDNLYKLIVGDKIYIEDEKGVITTFVVHEIQTYDKDDATLDVFMSDDDKSHLNLITCTGVWNKAEKIYSKRLVVFTNKE